MYAPYSNIGAVNFENTTGYINIPDQNVVYTRLDDEDQQGGGTFGMGKGPEEVNDVNLNDGRNMVFQMQDAEKNNKLMDD